MAIGASQGTVITFDSSFFAAITGVNWSGVNRAAIETTTLGTTTAKTFIADELFDAGGLDCDFLFNGGARPPIDDAVSALTIQWGGLGTGYNWAASGFMTDFSATAGLGEMLTASGTIKFTGTITIS